MSKQTRVKGLRWMRGAWWIDYRANGRRYRQKIGLSKTLAESALAKVKTEITENKFLDIKRECTIRFEDFANEFFMLHSKVNKKSWDRDDVLIKNLNKVFKDKFLLEITPMAVEQYKTDRKQTAAPATVNREVACLKCIFNKAVEWGKIKDNPIKNVRLLKENNSRLRFLEKEEITRLLEKSSKHLRPILVVAFNTGMRKSEIFNLKWHDCDFKNGFIYLMNTKNGDKREIPMNEAVRTALIQVRKQKHSPYIFCNKNGQPFTNVRKSFFTALEKAGIKDFRLHDARHTFASQLAMAGVDLNTVRELLGHKSLDMTLRYSHLSQDHKKRAVDVLDGQMGTGWALPNSATFEPQPSVLATH